MSKPEATPALDRDRIATHRFGSPTVRETCPATSLRRLPDSAIVQRCRIGDHAAWRELVDRYSRYVFAIATQGYRLADDDAEDVFQEVFARTFQHLDRLRDDAAVRPWLAQLTRRLCIDRLRSSVSKEVLAGDDDLAQGPHEIISALDDALTVQQILATLPAQSREILERFFLRDESYRTIGEALDIPSGTIASRISRALASLREALEGADESSTRR